MSLQWWEISQSCNTAMVYIWYTKKGKVVSHSDFESVINMQVIFAYFSTLCTQRDRFIENTGTKFKD